MEKTTQLPIAHVDDGRAVSAVVDLLQDLHGPTYDFAVGTWEGETFFTAQDDCVVYRFIVLAENAELELEPGDLVRGFPENGSYQGLAGRNGEVTASHREELWPGDVVVLDRWDQSGVTLHGRGTYFAVRTEGTPYRPPRLSLLRHLDDHPGGCAAYAGAFRRQPLPPQRPEADLSDHRGVNRVNEHTLDMRYDRTPHPIRHYHGPIRVGSSQVVNHSETAIVLPRSVYGLPEVDKPDQGHLLIYPQPDIDPGRKIVVPVRPGSIVVTPATSSGVMGHCFENTFAMLIAIPGFLAPYNLIPE